MLKSNDRYTINLSLFKSDPEDIQLEKDRVNIEAYEQNLKDCINIESFDQNLEMCKRSGQTDLQIHLPSQLLQAAKFLNHRDLAVERLAKPIVELAGRYQRYQSEAVSAIAMRREQILQAAKFLNHRDLAVESIGRYQMYQADAESAIARQLKQILPATKFLRQRDLAVERLAKQVRQIIPT